MKAPSIYVVVYDISSDGERTRVDKLLLGFGVRAQKSVFECTLNKRGKTELITKLKKLGLKTGFVKVYRLEYTSAGDVIGTQKQASSIDAGTAYVM